MEVRPVKSTKVLTNRAKKALDFSVHLSAKPAFDFFNSQVFLFDKNKFPSSAIELLSKGLTLHATQENKQRIEIISGFESIGFSLSNMSLDEHDIIVHTGISNSEIESRSWRGVLRSLMTSISAQNLELFRRELNHSVPPELMNEMFHKKQLCQNQMAQLTSMSRSALAQQYTKHDVIMNSLPKAKSTLFEQLVQEQCPDDR